MTAPMPGEWTELASGIYLEGLCIDDARQTIWYSDVIAGGVHGVTFGGEHVATLDPQRMWTGGILMNADGAVLSSGQGGIRWNHPGTGRSGWLIEEIDGRPINGVNEMWPDGEGGIVFGTLDIEHVIAAKPTRPVALYRLTRDGRVRLLADDLRFTNGIGYDPHRCTLYCCATFDKALAWDVGPDFALSNRRTLLDRDDCDGLALDADGDIWIAGVFSPGVIRCVAPDGQERTPFATPPGATTQMRFGGADGRDIAICLVPADAGEALRDGKPLSGASRLMLGRSPVPGYRIPPAAFDLD
jgi:sugar lactone lactonase YvrE